MCIIDNIISILKEKKLKQSDLCDYIGINTSTLTTWKSRKTDPPARYIIHICEFLNVSPYILLTGKEKSLSSKQSVKDEQDFFEIFNNLSNINKVKVMERAKTLAEIEKEATVKPITMNVNATYIDLYDLPVSAGLGTDLSGYDKEQIKIKQSNEAEQADFCLRISGDSMEPDFHNGDIVLVRGCPTISVGSVGIFVVNGSGYIKELGRNKLISLNDEYDDILLTENDSVWCMGEVIGTLENDDFLD